MLNETKIDIYKRAKELTEKQYRYAKLSTDGPEHFNYQENLIKNIKSIDFEELGVVYDASIIIKSIQVEQKVIDYDNDLIKKIINSDLSIEEILDEISYIYPRSLLVCGMQKRNNNLTWVKLKLRSTNEIFELGIKVN